MVSGAVLASAILVFAGANPAHAPEVDELSIAAFQNSSFPGEIAAVETSYDIETGINPTSLEIDVPTPNFVELAKVAVTEAIAEAPVVLEPITGDQITAIGDSLMVGATPFMEELLPGITIDGRVGRPMPEGMAILDDLLAQDAVGDYVVLGLATNAGVTMAQFDEIINKIGPDRTLIVVNAWGDRSWIPGGNDEIALADQAYGSQLIVADWYNLILENQDFIGPDGIHANEVGKQAYANLVMDALDTASQLS